jgi:hypothetical protein
MKRMNPIPQEIDRRGDRNVLNPKLTNDGPAHDVRPWLLRIIISAVAILAFVVTVVSKQNQMPFSALCDGVTCQVTAAWANTGTSPLRVGDQIVIPEQSFASRAVLLATNVSRDQNYEFRVRRGLQRLRMWMHAIPAAGLPGTGSPAASRTIVGFALLFGLLMLWRGETAASRGLCLFALSLVVGVGAVAHPLDPPWNLVGEGLVTLLGGPVALFGIYLTADALVHADSGSRAARRIRAAYVAALALLYLSEAVPQLLLALGSGVPLYNGLQVLGLALAAIVWIVPLVYLLHRYRVSPPESRLRIRWFIVAVALLLPVLICNMLLQSGNPRFQPWADFLVSAQILLDLALFTILSYAALSQRLVAVRFVLNRAVVFGVLTASLIGVLSLLESLIERSVISREAGLALDIAVPLLLGVSIHRIHRWGEESVERVVFRREYRARHEISNFVRDAGFIADPATLFERTVAVFAAHAGGHYAALYLTGKFGYDRAGVSDVSQGLPERIAIDDVAMVRLRATLAPLDLFTLPGPLGAAGLALPLVIRGRLEGVLVCGPKAEGRYAQAEVEFLGKAAADITACVIALKAELQGRLVSQIVDGTLSASHITEEARRLATL